MLQDEDGQIAESWSVSAGLDYPAVGPEHAFLKDSGRADYVGATDAEALDAFAALARAEGIICAFESAHAVAHALKLAEAATSGTILLVNLSGRGDKDMAQAAGACWSCPHEPLRRACSRAAATQGAFGAFVMLGDPDLETSAAILDVLVEGGADMLEVGIPFSDPVADGPVIQAAAVRALAAGVHAGRLLRAARRLPRAPSGRARRHPHLRQSRASRAAASAFYAARRRGRRGQRARRRRADDRGRRLMRRRRAPQASRRC